MRQIILDTETTGLEPAEGHRIIEIGCIELIKRRRTGRSFHRYLCPDRTIDRAAQQVHGLTNEFLAQQPRFADVVEEFLQFIHGAELVIHNAAFDLAFLDAELQRLPGPPRRMHLLCPVIDTLMLARQLHPGQRNSLDALCKRYGVDNLHREVHGALLDAQLLLDVYLAMTGGQADLVLGEQGNTETGPGLETPAMAIRPRGALRIVRASVEELAAHEQQLALIDKASGGRTLWRALETAAASAAPPACSPVSSPRPSANPSTPTASTAGASR